MRVLVAEAEPKLMRAICVAFKAESFAVDVVGSGAQALELASHLTYDIIVLDLSLGQTKGLDVLTRLRARRVMTPVLVLTGHASVAEKVEALEAGADDLLVIPFSVRELVARVRALLRRPATVTDVLRVGDLEMDPAHRVVTRCGTPIYLTNREFALLELLMRNAGRPVTRSTLVEHVWNGGFEGLTNIVDVYINYLRAKIDRGFEPKLIRTAYGIGYTLINPAETKKIA